MNIHNKLDKGHFNSMKVRFMIHYPVLMGPLFTEVYLEVKDNFAVKTIKRELIPKSVRESYEYRTYSPECRRYITIKEKAPTPSLASIVREVTPPIEKQLVKEFGVRDLGYPEMFEVLDSSKTSLPYLHVPSYTFGDEAQVQEVAETFVSLLKQARLDNNLSLTEQIVEEGSRLFLSIDIDFATRCSRCNREMRLGHIYSPSGTDNAGFYTDLDVFCPTCNRKRTVGCLPPVVTSVSDKIRRKLFGLYNNKGVQVALYARKEIRHL